MIFNDCCTMYIETELKKNRQTQTIHLQFTNVYFSAFLKKTHEKKKRKRSLYKFRIEINYFVIPGLVYNFYDRY